MTTLLIIYYVSAFIATCYAYSSFSLEIFNESLMENPYPNIMKYFGSNIWTFAIFKTFLILANTVLSPILVALIIYFFLTGKYLKDKMTNYHQSKFDELYKLKHGFDEFHRLRQEFNDELSRRVTFSEAEVIIKIKEFRQKIKNTKY